VASEAGNGADSMLSKSSGLSDACSPATPSSRVQPTPASVAELSTIARLRRARSAYRPPPLSLPKAELEPVKAAEANPHSSTSSSEASKIFELEIFD